MSWAERLWWLPTGLVAAMAIVAVAGAVAQPAATGKRLRLAVVVLVGLLAIAGSVWQQTKSRAVLRGETAQLQELAARLDEVGRLLPAAPGSTGGGGFASVTAGISALKAKIPELEDQVRDLRQQMRGRTISSEAAAKLADDLRQFGSHRVVVSCAPDDVEAFTYANQIANVLRMAGWDALGPEKTTIFGEAPAMGVKLFVRSGVAPPPAADVLIKAFTRFNIPYESGVTPSDAIPDPATTELFVSHKP
ncbi:MAG: hypothetical protein ACM3JG_12275 [Thiohalocapsa sp.]